MEEVKTAKERLEQRRNVYDGECEKIERKQINEYDGLLREIISMKENREKCQEDINKNLDTLIAYNHRIQNLLYDSEQLFNLPVSYSLHQETIELLADMALCLNDLCESDGLLNKLDKQKDIDVVKLHENVIKAIRSLESEANRARFNVSQINDIKNSIIRLQKCFLDDSSNDGSQGEQEEDSNGNSSIL